MSENFFNALGGSGGILASDILSTDTNIQLVYGGGARLPNAPFRLTLTDGLTVGGVLSNCEIIFVGAKNGDSLSNITRQYEINLNGGAARGWGAGTRAVLNITAGMLQNLADKTLDGSSSLSSIISRVVALEKAAIKPGMIMKWKGTTASIPTGWALCDGKNGTVDLVDKFIIGAGTDENGISKTNVTGTLTKSGGNKDAIVVAHDHGITDPGHGHNYTHVDVGGSEVDGADAASLILRMSAPATTGTSATGITINSNGASGVNANLPPYFALAYIEYTGE